MITEKITVLWRGKELSECTKEELIECIYELRKQHKNANVGAPTTGKWDIPYYNHPPTVWCGSTMEQ